MLLPHALAILRSGRTGSVQLHQTKVWYLRRAQPWCFDWYCFWCLPRHRTCLIVFTLKNEEKLCNLVSINFNRHTVGYKSLRPQVKMLNELYMNFRISSYLICPPFALMAMCTPAGMDSTNLCKILWSMLCGLYLTIFQRASCDVTECHSSMLLSVFKCLHKCSMGLRSDMDCAALFALSL